MPWVPGIPIIISPECHSFERQWMYNYGTRTWIYLFHKDYQNCQLDRLSIVDLPLQKLQTSKSNTRSHTQKQWWKFRPHTMHGRQTPFQIYVLCSNLSQHRNRMGNLDGNCEQYIWDIKRNAKSKEHYNYMSLTVSESHDIKSSATKRIFNIFMENCGSNFGSDVTSQSRCMEQSLFATALLASSRNKVKAYCWSFKMKAKSFEINLASLLSFHFILNI